MNKQLQQQQPKFKKKERTRGEGKNQQGIECKERYKCGGRENGCLHNRTSRDVVQVTSRHGWSVCVNEKRHRS
jgi:hypothetical protein